MHVRNLTERWLVKDLEGDCRLIQLLVGIITLNKSTDSAVTCVVTEIIAQRIGEPTSSLEDFLSKLYATIQKVDIIHFVH